jgi:hypothetical protein
MNVQDALSAAERNLAGYEPSDRDLFMRGSYWALVDFFCRYVKIGKPETILAGALAVYGWMPTMLRSCDVDTVRDNAKAFKTFRSAPDAAGGLNALAHVDLQFVNRSTVGTSKFLHFLNPAAAPIWDRRVAAALGVTAWVGTYRVGTYREYWAALGTSAFTAPEALLSVCNAEKHAASDLRLKEAALYLTGWGPRSTA